MTRKIQIAVLFLTSVAMLGLTGCPRRHHYRDHHPPPPSMDHHHMDHNGSDYNH